MLPGGHIARLERIRQTVVVAFDDERIEILSGIGMGEQVITTWSSELHEGSLVNIVSRDGKAEAKSQAAEPESQAAEPEADSAENDSQ